MWLEDIFIYATPELGVVIGQNCQYDPDNFVDSIAVIFKGGEPIRVQLVDADTRQVEFLTVSNEALYTMLAKFLEVIKSQAK